MLGDLLVALRKEQPKDPLSEEQVGIFFGTTQKYHIYLKFGKFCSNSGTETEPSKNLKLSNLQRICAANVKPCKGEESGWSGRGAKKMLR